ncbi:MAG: hypothetical protein OXI38_04255 [Bacteroidota bacterium]|nr:hypothetical protein [Bacteroidota bacterium]
MLVGADGAVAVLDATAHCAATEYRRPVRIEAAYVVGDSVLMQARYSPHLRPEVYAVSHDLEMMDTWRIAKPEFRRLNALLRGFAGRSMECFADGPYYTYGEWPEALPVFGHGSMAQVDPVFFSERVRDIGIGLDLYQR